MFSLFRNAARDRRTAKELYGVIVTRALAPEFFAERGVRDTPEGRIGMMMLHLFLVIDRLMGEGSAGRKLARLLAEAFVVDVDDNLREMGVGDLSVPKKVKSAAQALQERCRAYRDAQESFGEEGLSTSLAATLPGLEDNPARAAAIARYVVSARRRLSALGPHELLAGQVSFPALDSAHEPAPVHVK